MPLVKIEPYSANSSADFTFNNLIVTGNLYSNYSNSAFQAANSAGVYANAAFAQANTGGAGTDTWARSAANSASSYANGAFAAANTGSGGASGSYANSAFQTANSAGVYANAAFAAANTGSGGASGSYANSAYLAANSAGIYANAAFAIANAAWSGTTGTHANSAYASANNANVVNITQNTNITSAASYANSAFQAANSAGSYANSSFATANNANVVNITQNTNITSAASYANGAFAAANAASSGTTGTHANSAYQAANSAGVYANSAFLKANNALANTTGTFGGTLTVAGTLNADGLSITGTGGTISALNLIYSNTIFANSNVGIGVTTTSAKLDLGGTGVEVPQIIWSRGNDDSAFISKLKTGNTGINAAQSSIGLDYLTDFASIKFYRASTAGEIHWYLGTVSVVGTEQMRLNSTGLGIGTSSPSAKLSVAGTATVTGLTTLGSATATPIQIDRLSDSTSYGLITLNGALTNATASGILGKGTGGDAGNLYYTSPTAHVFQIAATEKMRITAAGDVGIGTSSFSYSTSGRGLVELNGSTSSLYALKVNNVATAYFLATSNDLEIVAVTGAPIRFTTNGSERIRIDTSGYLYLGTTSAIGSTSSRMHILNVDAGLGGLTIGNAGGSTGTYCAQFVNSNGAVGNILTVSSATQYNTSSDYRLKNITGAVTGAKDFIMALKPKQGTWKIDGEKFVGFLAHEFQEVSPISVHGVKDAVDEDGKPIYQSMQASSSEVMANLISFVQELRAEVDALKSQINQGT